MRQPESELEGGNLPIIHYNGIDSVDARLLHRALKSGRDFPTWIKSKIDEYGFEHGRDFFAELSPNRGKTIGRPGTSIIITLDMAKELCMVERNELGRMWRQYFIQKEKEARGVSHLPVESKLFSGIKPVGINGRRLYPYKEILGKCGYSTRSSTSARALSLPWSLRVAGPHAVHHAGVCPAPVSSEAGDQQPAGAARDAAGAAAELR